VPKAAVDPEELRAFASELKRFNSEIQSDVSSLQHRFGRLAESWNDQEHAKFAAVFDKTMAAYGRLAEATEVHIPHLMRKAQRIRDYLGSQVGGGSRNVAQIHSPDIITDFRIQFMKFEEACKTAVAEVRSDCGRVQEWLRHAQLQHWKQALRKIDDIVRRARSDYDMARHGSDYLRKPSYIEEQKALQKAMRRKEEIQRKLEATKKWGMRLDQQTKKLMGPINNLGGLLESSAPVARARLDKMVQCLEEYFRESPKETA